MKVFFPGVLLVLCLCFTQSSPLCAGEDGQKWIPLPVPKGINSQGFIAVDRAKGDLYFNSFGYGLWKSSDGGETFEHLGNGKFFPNGRMSGAVAINPDDSKIAVFNFREGGELLEPNFCAYSFDSGRTWEPMQNYVSGFSWVATEPGKGQTAIAFGNNENGQTLSYSPDLGKTWTKLNQRRGDMRGMGVFSPNELVIAAWNGIFHSADAGKTWTNVSKETGCGGPLLIVKDVGVWISPKGLVMTRDHGKTWTVEGSVPPAPPLAFLPVALGKDEHHFFILTRDGLTETRDAGKTWKVLAALPVPADKYSSEIDLAFDPVHDLFYLCGHWHAPHGMMKYHWTK